MRRRWEDEICWNRYCGVTALRCDRGRPRWRVAEGNRVSRRRQWSSRTAGTPWRPERLSDRDGGHRTLPAESIRLLTAEGFSIALLNPLHARRFAEEDLARTKTDAIYAVYIARFAAQKRPAPSALPEHGVEELRELVSLREQTALQLGDCVRHLHQVVDLTFPEFTRYVRGLDTELATTILSRYPTAAEISRASAKALAKLAFAPDKRVRIALANRLIAAAKTSVGHNHEAPYRLQIKYACEDVTTLRQRAHDFERDLEERLESHEVGKLLTTIIGVGPLTVACIIDETGDPARFRSAAALPATAAARTVAILIFPDVEALDVVGPAEVFATAADLLSQRLDSGPPAYSTVLSAPRSGRVVTSRGVELFACKSLDDLTERRRHADSFRRRGRDSRHAR
jgi:transposase